MERLTLLKSIGLSCAVAGAVCVEVIKPKKGGHDDGVSSSDFIIGNIVVVLQVNQKHAQGLVTDLNLLEASPSYRPAVLLGMPFVSLLAL
jgi:hypothetical protein